MSDEPDKRWRCRTCNHVSRGDQILNAPSPFDPTDTLSACPKCKQVADFQELCEWMGKCDRQATSGTPLADGRYVRRCFEHRPEAMGEKEFRRAPGVTWDQIRKDK